MALMYLTAQSALLREANSGYSPSALAVNGSPPKALIAAKRDGLKVAIFVPSPDDPSIQFLAATGGLQGEIPTHDTSWLVNDERPGALVGSEVLAQYMASDYDTPIAARLGSQDASLLGNMVIIYDPSTVEVQQPGTFVIDGPDAANLANQFDFQSEKREGLSRRTSVDAVAPLMLTLVAILLPICSLLTGILFGQWYKMRDRVAIITGSNIYRLQFARGAMFAALGFVASTCVGAISYMSQPTTFDTRTYLAAVGALMTTSLIALILSSLRRKSQS
ncbi:MAG: hypothetical protein Q4G21_02755 [Dermabacter sp.]|nr:hypothetical protein [Dermabacter sp.]